ncbi:uncharacterized protein METZ01_LOCUS383807, partial [marine metagenome]
MIRTISSVFFWIFLMAGCSKKDNDTKSVSKEKPNQTENSNEGQSTMHAKIETSKGEIVLFLEFKKTP